MPLHISHNHDADTILLVWKITESLENLLDQVLLTDRSIFRLGNMKSVSHKCGFLAVRMLLQHAGYQDRDLHYDALGKPNLADGRQISISHSHDMSAIILSDKVVGLDMELRRNKIAIIADKFMESTLVLDKDDADYVRKLTVNWGIKEAIFKIRNEQGISFKDHIHAAAFEMSDKKTTAQLHFENLIRTFEVYFQEIDDYTVVYAFPI
jgi:4'-phosphopantetheinyl transferase